MTVHCTVYRGHNGNKIYYTNLRKVWKELIVINLYWKILKCFTGKKNFRTIIEVGQLNYWIKEYREKVHRS